MPAWFGKPPKVAQDDYPLPWVNDDNAGVWGDLWAEAFKIGDAVRIGGLVGCNVGVVTAYEKQCVPGEKKGWRMIVALTNGEEMSLAPHGVEKISLLEAMAEAARDD